MRLKDVKLNCHGCDSSDIEVYESKVYSISGTKKQKEELRKKYLLVRYDCEKCGFSAYELYDRRTGENVGDKIN